MSGSEKKWYSRGSTKDRKDREKEKGKYTGQKDPSSHGQQSGSGSKGGGGHGQKKSGGYDGPAHMNPITITSTSTAAANTKPGAESAGVAKRIDPPSDKDLKFAITSLSGNSKERKNSKGDLEYYKEMYRQLKSENETLKNTVDELGDEMESAKARARVNNQAVAETKELMNGELNRLQKSLEKAQSNQEGVTEQLQALQKRYTKLNQDKDRVEAEKITLDQLHKARIAELEQKLSQSSKELSHFHIQLQQAQDDDITVNSTQKKIRELERELETSKTALQEEVSRVKRRNDQITNMKATNKSLMAQLNEANAAMEETIKSKQALEIEYQQFKEHNENEDKEKIKQLENSVITQTVNYAKEIEKIKKDATSALQEREFDIKMMKIKLQEAEKKQQTLQETNDEKEQELRRIINEQATKMERMKTAIKENQSVHQDKIKREKKEKEDLIKQLEELQDEKCKLEQQIKVSQDKDQEIKAELSKLKVETEAKLVQVKEKHKAELEEKTKAVKAATADKENLGQMQKQHYFVVEQKDEEIKNLQHQLEEKTKQIKELENNLRKRTSKSGDPTSQLQVEELVRQKEVVEQKMKEGYKEREDRITELEEFINDQVVELDKMEAAMKQTVKNKEISEKELNEALEKKQTDLVALQIACEKKDEEIHNLDQSLSQMSIDKEEMERISAKLAETEEKLTQANRELQASKKKEYSVPVSKDNDGTVSMRRLTKENSDLNNKCLELKKENESLNKRLEDLRKSCEMLRNMLQKDPGKGIQVEMATKNVEIDQLKQQITKLQKECEAMKSLTTEVSNKPTHEADQEFHSSVVHQPQDLSDQSIELQQKVKQLEMELESTKSAVEVERRNCEEKVKEMLHQSMNQSISIGRTTSEYRSQHAQGNTEELQKECERHEQTYEQLYASYQKLAKHYREKEEEIVKLNSQCSKLQAEVDEQTVEMDKIQQELQSVSGLSHFIQEQHEKLVLAEQDRDTTKAMMMNQKQSQDIKHTELNAKVIEVRNNYSLLVSQVESKNAEIDDLIRNKEELEKKLKQVTDSKEIEIAAKIKDLESRLTQRSAIAVTTTPATSDVASNTDLESLHSFSLETAIPSPTSTSLTIPTQEQPSLQLKKKDQTIAELQERIQQLQTQQTKSSDDTGVGDPCVEHTQSGGVGELPDEGNCDANNTKSRRLDQLLQELEQEKQSKKEIQDDLAREQEATARSQEILSTYEAELQKLRSEKNEIEKQMERIKAEMQVNQLAKDNEKLTTECAKLKTALQKTHQVTTDNEKLQNEVARLRTALEREQKEAQTKSDIYKNKTEQFQKQWRKREEAEKTIKDLTDQLNVQRHLNTQQQNTIDDLLRKNKGINPKVPSNVSGTPVDNSHQQQDHHQTSHDATYHSMTTPHNYPSSQHPSNYTPSMASKYPPQHDPTVGHTNAEYHYPQQHQQEVWQQERQLQQQYQMNQHQQNLQQRGQGRGMFHNQGMHPGGGDMYAGGTVYPHKHLPPPSRDNFGGQPMSLGRVNVPQRDYSTTGTNAAMKQDTPHRDDILHDRLNNPPMSLDSFRSKNPAPVSEGINEEIRIQADLQRRQQQQDEFESGLAYDPYLICHKCKRQFREGQLPEYRHHIDNCQQ